MNKTFPTIAGIFGIATTISFNLHYTNLALLFAAIAIISFSVALFVYFNNRKNPKTDKINIKDFTFIDPPGYYTHAKYPNQKICPICLVKDKLISPVSEVDKNAWYCTVCKQPLSGTKGEVFTVDY